MNRPLGIIGGDNIKPTCAMTSPAAGTVVGTVNLTATATDNYGVVGVQFKVDGVNFGAEDTSAPYSIPLDTTTLANGSHTFSAVARDQRGNTQVDSVTVTVSNIVYRGGGAHADTSGQGSGSPGNTWAAAFGITATQAGDLVVIAVGAQSVSGLSVADNLGQTYTLLDTAAAPAEGGSGHFYVYYKTNSAAGANAITVTYVDDGSDGSSMAAAVAVYSGLSSTIDISSGISSWGFSGTFASGSYSAAVAREAIIACVSVGYDGGVSDNFATPNSPFTWRQQVYEGQNPSTSIQIFDSITSSPGSGTVNGALAASAAGIVGLVVSFEG